MDIVISPLSGKPIYVQIVEQISAQVVLGELASGTALPPIRTVARQLGISVITVKKAWEELQRQGFVTAIVGKGTFVADHHPTELSDRRRTMALERLTKDLEYYRGLGLTEDEFTELVRQSYGRLDGVTAGG